MFRRIVAVCCMVRLWFLNKSPALPRFRTSRFIHFSPSVVIKAPMDLNATLPQPLSTDKKIFLLECRVEVWQSGVALEIWKQTRLFASSKQVEYIPSLWRYSDEGALVSQSFIAG